MNSDNVKKVDFLKHDLNPNVDHQMVKSNKSLYNFKKKDLYNHHHSTLHDFTINAKNTFADHPFTGSANWYVDFELPSLNYLYDSFVLRYKLSNDVNGSVVQILPSPFHIDRVSLLKNSNVLSESDNEEIFLFNLHKYANKNQEVSYDFDLQCQTGLTYTGATDNTYSIPLATDFTFNMEIPICLTKSLFLSSAIKNQLVVRIYFRGNICPVDPTQNKLLKMIDLKLMLRMQEQSSHNLHKEPKFNHLFTKKILTQINVPSISKDNYYTLNIQGFNSIASFCLVYFRDPDVINNNYYKFNYPIDFLSICDNTNKNILQSDIILEKDYNRYLISENFRQFSIVINKLCPYYNNGNVFLVPFCNNADHVFNSGFNGGISFKESNDYKIKFKAGFNSSTSLILNILWFSPSNLELCYGDVKEILS